MAHGNFTAGSRLSGRALAGFPVDSWQSRSRGCTAGKPHRMFCLPQFAADTGTLFQRLKYAGSVPPGYISESSGWQRPVTMIRKPSWNCTGRSSPPWPRPMVAASLLPALEDLLSGNAPLPRRARGGLCLRGGPVSGKLLSVSYLRSNDLVFALEMDMSSGKLIQLVQHRRAL